MIIRLCNWQAESVAGITVYVQKKNWIGPFANTNNYIRFWYRCLNRKEIDAKSILD